MWEIEFFAVYSKRVKISKLEYTGGDGSYQFYIDNYYQGELVKKNNQWEFRGNKKIKLTADEIAILGDMIENNS